VREINAPYRAVGSTKPAGGDPRQTGKVPSRDCPGGEGAKENHEPAWNAGKPGKEEKMLEEGLFEELDWCAAQGKWVRKKDVLAPPPPPPPPPPVNMQRRIKIRLGQRLHSYGYNFQF